MQSALVALPVAFAGYSLLNVGQAVQKIGLDRTPRERLGGWSVWALGTIMTFVSVMVVLYAVSVGNVSLVGAMAGTGLVSLVLFSRFVMNERTTRRELAGVGVVIAGAVLVSLQASGTGDEFRPGWIIGLLGGAAVVYAILWILSGTMSFPPGIAIASLAGVLGGGSTVVQKISTGAQGAQSSLLGSALEADSGSLADILARLANPYTVLWVGMSVVSMVVLQFAYGRDRAIRIIPSFSAHFIAMPVLGGVLGFGEPFSAIQIVGVLGIVAGVFAITTGRAEKES